MSYTPVFNPSTAIGILKTSRVKYTREGQTTIVRRGEVELTIDVDYLFRTLGSNALINKTGKASLGSGRIKARVLWRMDEDGSATINTEVK